MINNDPRKQAPT